MNLSDNSMYVGELEYWRAVRLRHFKRGDWQVYVVGCYPDRDYELYSWVPMYVVARVIYKQHSLGRYEGPKVRYRYRDDSTVHRHLAERVYKDFARDVVRAAIKRARVELIKLTKKTLMGDTYENMV